MSRITLKSNGISCTHRAGAKLLQHTEKRGFHQTHADKTPSSGYVVREEKQMFLGSAAWPLRSPIRPQIHNQCRKIKSGYQTSF